MQAWRLVAMFLSSMFWATQAGCTPAGDDAGDLASGHVRGEVRLEERLIAPCCWTQTLDTHQSELSSSLRAEIRERLRHGEEAMSIEDDMAARYGERIRAVPRGRDPRSTIPSVVGVGLLASAFALLVMLRRWMKRGQQFRLEPIPVTELLDDYDSRVDEELAKLEER
jgi:cytochrome c-type biogenesis protein CcmH